MSWIDWLIVLVFFGSIAGSLAYLSRYTRSVADFLAANRSAKRYLLTVSSGAASFGAISMLAACEQFTSAGFVPAFWQMMMIPISMLIAASGWVVYRFRETRAFTLAQFFELRYSRNFRIFMGALAFLSGILNYGIFPAVTAKFFLYFCGLPSSVDLGLFCLPTFPALMAIQLGLALYFTLGGGQVAIMITDFLQGQFTSITLILCIAWLGFHVSWDQVAAVLSHAPAGHSYINPFDTGKVKDFNFWYYAIAAFGAFYNAMGWQGSQAFNASAANAHEARMGKILGEWRSAVTSLLPVALAVSAIVILAHPDFAQLAETARGQLAALPESQVQSQMTVPMVLRCIFPIGLMGLFTAAMYSAAISTDNSYLHSWGSIFIQDVVLPILGRPLSPKHHLLALRGAIVGVAVFAFFFSLFFRQTEHILLFFAITGSIFLGGAGSVIIGGLYWKRGTNGGAWCAMIVGGVLSVGGLMVRQVDPDFCFNGQQIFFGAIVCSVLSYIIVSVLQNRVADLDRILHRGPYRHLLPLEEQGQAAPPRGWAAIGPGPNFTRGDRFIFWITMGMAGSYFLLFISMIALHFTVGLSEAAWLRFWHIFLGLALLKAVVATIWFLIGGYADLRDMLKALRTERPNLADDGTVVQGHNRGES